MRSRSRLNFLAAATLGALGLLASPAAAEDVESPIGGPITINDGAVANPYPAEVKLTGADGEITDVDVVVRMSHASPDDVDMAIVSPERRVEMLMSDACGGQDLVNADLFFDQDASTGLSDLGPCAAGSFKATDHTSAGIENFPPPGPGTAATHDLDNFVGESPNGTWQLAVLDDSGGDVGSIASWSYGSPP